MAKQLTYKEVWDTLSKVDCSDHIEKKMNLSYLSWAWAWGVLMEHYPNAQFTFQAFTDELGIMRDAMFYPDGSASVHVTVSIGDLARSMWLPVMDNRNNAIRGRKSFLPSNCCLEFYPWISYFNWSIGTSSNYNT